MTEDRYFLPFDPASLLPYVCELGPSDENAVKLPSRKYVGPDQTLPDAVDNDG
jgi:hypothetical protein